MAKAKIGSGRLEAFKKGSTDSESIAGSTSKEHTREGFVQQAHFEKASRSSNELTPFKDSSLTPGAGVNTSQESVPKFRERRDCGIPYDEYKAFED